MLLGHEIKQLFRTPIRTFAIFLALSLITGMMAVAYGLQLASDHLSEQVESEYTTIAYIPSTPLQYLDAKTRRSKSYLSSKNPLILALNSGKFESETALAIDTHSRMMAYDSNLLGTISDIAEINEPNNVAVFAVQCDEILPSGQYGDRQVYYYNFTVEQTVSLHENLQPPLRIVAETMHYNLDAVTSALEIGKTYLIWGFYEDLGDGVAQLNTPLHFLDFEKVMRDEWGENGYFYLFFPSPDYPTYQLPLFAEYSGSVKAYMERDTSGMWEMLMYIMQISHSSLQILSADHPYALRPFIDGHAVLTEGDFFTEEQLESGAHIALISNILAEKNGLSVGDTLDLHFYQSTYSDDKSKNLDYFNGIEMMIPTQLWGESEWEDPVYRQEKGVSRTPVSEQDDIYTVVGIYSTDGWINRSEYLHPNTVIIPQASLTATYTWDLPQFDCTFILPNGGVDAFEVELEAAGFGGMVHYYDQGYASIITGVEAICHSTRFVCNIVRVLWVLAVAMILFLFTWMQMPTGKVKYRLGVSNRRIWCQMSFSALVVILFSCIGGFAGSLLLYDRALEWMMQADFTSYNATFSTMSINVGMLNDLLGLLQQNAAVFARACGGQLVLLLLLAAIFAAVATLRKKSFRV